MSRRNCGTRDLTTHGFRANSGASLLRRLGAALRRQRGGDVRLVRVDVGDGRDADARRLDDVHGVDADARTDVDGRDALGRLTALVGVGYFLVWTVFGMAAFPLGVEDQEQIRLMQNALGPIDHVVQRTEELRNG